MKFLRFIHNGEVKSGVMEEGMIREIKGSIFKYAGCSLDLCEGDRGNLIAMDEVKLLVPCMPSKVVAVGLNYVDHIKEFGNREMPDNPTIFIKLSHTIIGPEEDIKMPAASARVDYEAELAVVIGKFCKDVSTDEAAEYIFGATCLNDVTARDIQKADGQWTRAKNYETFCPIGPFIVNGLDYNSLDIKLVHNGEVKQSSNTSSMLFNVYQLVSFISKVIPLDQGDVIATGTPCGVGPVSEGDVVEVVIEGIGTLRNYVKKA